MTLDTDLAEAKAQTRTRRVMTVWGAAFTALVLVVAIAGWIVWSSPAPNEVVQFTLLLVWAVLFLCWLAWLAAEVVEARRAPRARRWIWPVAAGVVLVVTTALIAADVPLKVRFERSKSDLTAYANRMLERNTPDDPGIVQDACVGSYCFDVIVVVGDGVHFGMTTDEFGSEHGFVYSPDEVPRELPEDAVDASFEHYESLGDGWYRFSYGWDGP